MLITPPSFDDKISLGTVIQIITIISGFGALLLKRAYKSNEESTRVEEHQQLLKEQSITQSAINRTLDRQQWLLEEHDWRLEKLEDSVFEHASNREGRIRRRPVPERGVPEPPRK